MKPRYPHSRANKAWLRSVLLMSAILALVFIPFYFDGPLKNFGEIILSTTLKPLISIKNTVTSIYGTIKTSFADKNALTKENNSLKSAVQGLEIKLKQDELFREEYFALLEKFGREPQQNFLMARVMINFAELPYDTISLDLGKKSGVEEGMKITAYDGSIFIGTVRGVKENFSRGVLISSLNEEINVIFGKAQISAIARGRGNGELESILPRDIVVEIGEKVYTLNQKPLLVGFVGRIEKKAVDPLQKITIVLPVNIQDLRSVFLLP